MDGASKDDGTGAAPGAARAGEAPGDDAPPEPGMGPGVRPRPGLDPSVPTAAVLVAAGWIPIGLWDRVLENPYFGPIAYPAILAMAGVLAALVGLLRGVDLRDRGLRRTCIIIGALGLLRVFLVPLAQT